jgi:FkbM family methyltransferase
MLFAVAVAVAASSPAETPAEVIGRARRCSSLLGGVAPFHWHMPGFGLDHPTHRCPAKLRYNASSTFYGKDGRKGCCEPCEMKNAKGQRKEDVWLLYTLVRAAGGEPGTFVELGAYNGVDGSNTYCLEKCYGWHGVLIEANPVSYGLMRAKSGRSEGQMVNAAICDGIQSGGGAEEVGTATFVTTGVVAHLASISSRFDKMFRENNATDYKYVQVPCRPLDRIMQEHGVGHGVTFLSLDVEGAEEIVLGTVDPALFKAVFVEVDGTNVTKDHAVHRRLLDAGLHFYWKLNSGHPLRGGVNHLYLRPEKTCPAWASPGTSRSSPWGVQQTQQRKHRNSLGYMHAPTSNETHMYLYFADETCPSADTSRD